MYPGVLSRNVCTISPLEYIFISQCAPAVTLHCQCYMQWPFLTDSAYISSETEQMILFALTCTYNCACTSEKQALGDAFNWRSKRAAGLTSPGRQYISAPTKGGAHAGEDKLSGTSSQPLCLGRQCKVSTHVC